jgi:hypothetical protein
VASYQLAAAPLKNELRSPKSEIGGEIQKSEKITMYVGDQRSIRFKDPLKISISRKSFIHLIEKGDGLMRITALKTGVIAMTVSYRDADSEVIFIDIRPRKTHSERRTQTHHVLPRKNVDQVKQIYSVNAKIELQESNSLESQGIQPTASLVFDMSPPKITESVRGGVGGHSDRTARRIIGNPTFVIGEDEPSTIKSGGESLHRQQHQDGHSISTWNEYGLVLTTSLHKIDDASVGANVQFSLKTPSSNGESYSLNQIDTYSMLKLGKRQLIGTLDLASNDQQNRSNIFISKVPIIGPLFKQSTLSDAHATLWLWLEAALLKDLQ